ncbi:cell division protein ZapA [Temperatibacter marinus]|uniref:Cell division protein ZapA n=1 Tax=Temperatibacter marinus TaxID=1456591 RepID=A0AA52EJM9_9PROT|nr:cell division protein ZapA [Temperatibacter marinus]WND04015.1 cell division protein ZapA [Temperatibacter marinus]
MAQVTVSVSDRSYTLACASGEEARLKELADYVDSKVAYLKEKLGHLSEGRALLMAAIMITDELQDVKAGHGDTMPLSTGLSEETVAGLMNDVAAELETIAAE